MDKGNLSVDYQGKNGTVPGEAAAPLQTPAEIFTISRKLEGQPMAPGICIGRVQVVKTQEDLDDVENGAVVVCKDASRRLMVIMPRIKGLIAESGGMLAFGFRSAIAWGVPAVRGARGVLDSLKTGDMVRIDGFSGDIQVLQKAE